MRAASVDMAWKDVYRISYPLHVSSLQFSKVPGLLDSTIKFDGGITAICGENGSGKTTLMELLYILLSRGSRSLNQSLVNKLKDSKYSCDINNLTNVTSISSEECVLAGYDEEVEYELIHINPSRDAPKLQTTPGESVHFEDILESLDEKILNAKELKVVNYVQGKNYSEIKIFEIEGEFDAQSFPYFRVTINGVSYGAESMGMGEFSLLFMLWHLFRVKSNSILLIEEPESFVPPRAQRNFTNYLAYVSSKLKVWVILTTHSEHILHRIPHNHVRMLVPRSGMFETKSASSVEEYFERLGLNSAIRAFIYVEDIAARRFVRDIISYTSSRLKNIVEIISLGGESKIKSVLRTLPKSGTSYVHIGVFDGDMKVTVDSDDFEWPVLFLPGDRDPEDLLISHINCNLKGFAEHIVVDFSRISIIISAMAGVDKHDYIKQIASSLGLTEEIVFSHMTKFWYIDSHNRITAAKLISDVEQHIKP